MGPSKKAPKQPNDAAPRRSTRLFKDNAFHDHKIPIECVVDDCDADATHQHPPSLQFYNPRPAGDRSTDQGGGVARDTEHHGRGRSADEQRRIISENATILDRREFVSHDVDPIYGPDRPQTPSAQIAHGQPPTPWAPQRLPFRSARSVRDEEEEQDRTALPSTPSPSRRLSYGTAISARDDKEEPAMQYELPGAHFLDEFSDHSSMDEEEFQRRFSVMIGDMEREEAEAFARNLNFPFED